MKKNRYLIVLMIFLSLFCCACSKKENTTEVIIEEFTTEDLDYVSIEDAQVGDIVSFGHYEQNIEFAGKEEILWDVLDEKDDSILLISHYILDVSIYDDEDNLAWADSDLRCWLNYDFYNNAFSENEKNKILVTQVYNVQTDEYSIGEERPIYYRKKYDYTTEDCLFVLSLEEAKKYYGAHIITDEHGYNYWFSNDIKSTFTPYAAQRLYDRRVESDKQTGYDKERKKPIKVKNNDQDWWMRTEAGWETDVIIANYYGLICNSPVSLDFGVRPAMWVKKK